GGGLWRGRAPRRIAGPGPACRPGAGAQHRSGPALAPGAEGGRTHRLPGRRGRAARAVQAVANRRGDGGGRPRTPPGAGTRCPRHARCRDLGAAAGLSPVVAAAAITHTGPVSWTPPLLEPRMFARLPPVTQALLIANVAVFLLQALLGNPTFSPFMLWPPLGFDPFSPGQSFQPWQLLTYGFLHGG